MYTKRSPQKNVTLDEAPYLYHLEGEAVHLDVCEKYTAVFLLIYYVKTTFMNNWHVEF